MIDRILHPLRGLAPRRFRDRVLVAMLTVALVPLLVFAVVVAADLGAVTRSTVDETNRSILQDQVDAHQRQVADQAQGLRVRVDVVAQTLRSLRDLATQALQAPPAGVAPPDFDEYRGVHYLSDGASTVLAGRPLGADFDPAVAGRDAAATAGLLGKVADLVHTAPGVIQDAWIADTVDTVVRTVPGIPAVRGALDARASAGEALLGADGGTPFSATAANGGAAGAAPPPWAGEPARPDVTRAADTTVNWTQTYPTGPASDPTARPGVTAWMPAGMGGRLRVGLDVSVGELVSGLLDLHPAGEPHAYPLLLSSANRLLAGGVPGGREFGPAGGGPLSMPADSAFRTGLVTVETTGHPQALPVHVGGQDKELFTAPVPGVEWVLATVVPKNDLLPEQAGLARGIQNGVSHILVHVLPVALLLCVAALYLAQLLARRLVGPVRELTVAAERLGAGRTDEPVPSQGADEVGQLAASLERMRREINASRDAILAAARELEGRVADRTAELRDRNEELVALNALAASLTRSLDPVAILRDALDTMRALVPLHAGRGWLDQGGALSAAAVHGDPEPLLDVELGSVAGRAVAEHRPVIVPGSNGQLVGLPLETGDGPLGALALATTRAELESRTRTLLRGVGDLVGLALRTARLSAEGRELAVLEERTRLAREIHDTLAQQLTGIVLQLEAAEVFLDRDHGRARQVVVGARDQARSALDEARRSVWDLRPTPLDQTGLAAALGQEARHWQGRTGISVRVRSRGIPAALTVDPRSEVALFRIAQEALANVAQHSHAGRVDIGLEVHDGTLRLSVEDDGDGFDVASRPPGRFGLVGMAERARLAGATLEIDSAAGAGTRVSVQLPLPALPVPASA